MPPVYLRCNSSCTLQRLERIVGIADRKLAGVGVVRLVRRAGLQNVREALPVFAGKAIGGAFGRRGLQVVHVAGLFLELHHPRAHVIEQAHGEGVAPLGGDVVRVAA